jgi:hypothetical protein
MIALLVLPAIRVSIACTRRYFSFKKGEGQVKDFSAVEEEGALITGSVWQEKRKKVIIKRDNLFIGHPERLKN